MFTLGARLAYDDRDFKPPTRTLTHPLIYQFPGRVLREHGGLFHSFRDLFYPERGGLIQAEFDYVTGGDADFIRYVAEVQRFHTLFWSNRILAGRLRLEKTHSISGGFVPFPDLPTLGGSQRLRAYERGAFRGEGALLLALEYRYPIWDTWNAFLFYEEGQVFDEYGDLDSGEFNSSIGFGLTLRTEGAFLLGVRVAHSAEEKLLTGFSLEQEF